MKLKMTAKRQQLLDAIKKHQGVVSASDIHKKLPNQDLVTIYRNLELFAEERLIKRVSLETNETLYEYQHQPHHHAICNDCNKVLHFMAADDKIKKLLNLNNFDIEEMEVLVKGKCCH